MTQEQQRRKQISSNSAVFSGTKEDSAAALFLSFGKEHTLDMNDMEELADRAWEQFKAFEESLKKVDSDGHVGDVSHLKAIIDLLEPHVHPNTKPLYELTTKEDMLPILISVASNILADQAITAFFRKVDKPVIDRCVKDVEVYS
jgi:hypothetical protein